MAERLRPSWLTVRLPIAGQEKTVRGCLNDLSLSTVCTHARCPNQAECYQHGRATFLLMGPNCSRRCRYCAVAQNTPAPLAADEPLRVAQAVQRLKLRHAVITSVTRDDLPDGGAQHFSATVNIVREMNPPTTIEILVPDFAGDEKAWRVSADCAPQIYNHNIETVARLFSEIRPQANFARSIAQLKFVKKYRPQLQTKSGLMVGFGETYAEIIDTALTLRNAQVTIITVGQYLPPRPDNYPVQEYLTPEIFARLRDDLLAMGFSNVSSAPLVRSSYYATA